MAKDLEEALVNIEAKLGGEEKPHMDLGWHLDYIESLIEGGAGGGGGSLKVWYELPGLSFPENITQEQFNEIKNLALQNQLAGIICAGFYCPLYMMIPESGIIAFQFPFFENDKFYYNMIIINEDLSVVKSDIECLVFPPMSPTSQLIPSITTSREQQNLTIGNGLTIENGALISNLSNFKYGTLYLKNITSNANSYTIELSFFDYIYDVIINGTNQLMGTSLTRDTFPSFLKNNITPRLFTTLITNIIDVHRKVAGMPYFDVTIIDQTNNAIFANCSTAIEGGVGFFCGTNEINLSGITFGDTFTVEYYGSWYGD